eukprot:6824676-Ditylum_brightwellii.AAC.1
MSGLMKVSLEYWGRQRGHPMRVGLVTSGLDEFDGEVRALSQSCKKRNSLQYMSAKEETIKSNKGGV